MADPLATQDSPDLPVTGRPPQWGIFKDGKTVVTADGVSVMEYKKDFDLPTFPIEGGAFSNYNKVELPADISVKFIAGTSVAVRKALLDSIEAIQGTLDVYDVFMPEKNYTSYNVDHVDFRRALSGGLGIISAEVWLREIRITASVTFTSTKTPAGAATKSNGQTQTKPPTTQQNQTLADAGFASDNNIVPGH